MMFGSFTPITLKEASKPTPQTQRSLQAAHQKNTEKVGKDVAGKTKLMNVSMRYLVLVTIKFWFRSLGGLAEELLGVWHTVRMVPKNPYRPT